MKKIKTPLHFFIFLSSILMSVCVLGQSFDMEQTVRKRPDLNGKLFRHVSTNSVYWIDQGYRRRIDSIKTFIQIFATAHVEPYSDIQFIEEGEPLTDNVRLIRCVEETAIYLLDGCHKRPIQNEEIFAQNNFNANSILDVDCVIVNCVQTGVPVAEPDINFPVKYEIGKGQGRILLIFENNNYIYPAHTEGTGILESFPPKADVFDYHTQSSRRIILNNLKIPEHLNNEQYVLEVLKGSEWVQYENFQWKEGNFWGQETSDSDWEKCQLDRIRFKLRKGEVERI